MYIRKVLPGIVLWTAWVATSCCATEPVAAADRPLNVLLIMADDVGFECFSSYGSKEYDTPRIDALAKQGIRFTNAHSTPLCTPTRVNLMSGKSNVFNYQDFGIYPAGEPTFANPFQTHGYRTAVAGKWQLQTKQAGKGITAGEAGFETWCLWNIPGGARERYWKPSFVQNGKLLDLPPRTFGPDVMTEFLIDFMTEDNDKPFLAYYPMILVHDPFVPTPDSDGGKRVDKAKRTAKRQKQNYVDMVAYMDKCVGRLVDALKASGKRDNTLVIFTGDNGTNAVLSSELNGKTVKGGKGYTHDYGTHVPLVANLPGRIPPGQVNEDLIAFSDFFPTIVQAAGLPPKAIKDGDGTSFWPQCLGQPGEKREWIYGYYFPRPYAAKLDNKYNHYEVRYARDKQYKLYDNGDLYDTLADVMEESPLPIDDVDAEQQAARTVLQRVLASFPSQGQAIRHDQVNGERKPGSQKRSNH
ncbi:sulfatase-like hydrolase/transferase [Rhodopirellula sp. JC639]|uniref:sulfatase-like hydrolase/transferase n=1 Tax=Stieleria mannarensis TaxID=2755585 RepID=UPI0015FF2F01|nr:sulfatase-like hydrolase/transferase [Rhodopirellula sp. JC639]